MPSLNHVHLIGNIGANADLGRTPTGSSVATFRLATREVWQRGDQKKHHTEWHNIEVWNEQAEKAAQALRAGRLVSVIGSLRTDTWEKGGASFSRTKIVAHRILFLDASGSAEGADELAGVDPTTGPAPF